MFTLVTDEKRHCLPPRRVAETELGIIPLDFTRQERIQLAKKLLLNPERSVGDVACACGFNHVFY